MRNMAIRFAKDEQGATMVEYGLLVGLIACACVVAIGVAATGIKNIFTDIGNYLTAVAGTIPTA